MKNVIKLFAFTFILLSLPRLLFGMQLSNQPGPDKFSKEALLQGYTTLSPEELSLLEELEMEEETPDVDQLIAAQLPSEKEIYLVDNQGIIEEIEYHELPASANLLFTEEASAYYIVD
ncbi:hypothetical protein AAG747_23980 [Rapidithrix thailandica]|uniref:Uncharacterized protein n=1 Tax=Rapidithrix thailandica TaxID=413964 RepID=A0AAW9SC24_9BACT